MSGITIKRALPRLERTSQYAVGPTLGQRRAFTSSLPHQKHGFPTFQPTSSPELDNILSKFRNTVFLPAHLSKQHRDLVYSFKHKKSLDTVPVTVEIGGDEIRLKHINRTKDVPNQRIALREALGLMKDKKDWDNFPLLLEGLHSAGRATDGTVLEQFVRKAGQAGRQYIVLESARRVSKTGFRINTRDLSKMVMWWIQHRALVNGFSQAETKKALSMAEQIAILMEDKAHAGGRVTDSEDPRTSPEVIGVLLQLSALNAKHQGGKDENGTVEKYAKSLLASLQDKELEGMLQNRKTDPARIQEVESNSMLQTVAPILLGVRTAISVLEQSSDTTRQLRDLETKLSAQVAQDVETLKAVAGSGERLGLWVYENTAGAE
ncbi:hypothetical protein VC83_08828 [Pseudogymnoascus destructans]|uniref:Uncharacterized protein n=2 Tax=Pseudogymnoascus destructans TaxID=655981 RepID=L8FNN7_PSED2|nr:uncharacterized protein VC83_08828 [Pseudogymnoascus destructans]ELR02522.1 hypothetical protein GMDG_01047 [Pseudogymnoascus destructans 20631-21]OAF54659.1 hypothetical protein VC83_08828 [Pseudogymnoascus destructans]